MVLKRLDSLDTRMGNLEVRMDNLENRMDNLEIMMHDLEKRITVLESTECEHGKLLKAIEHRVEENTAQINSLVENMTYIKDTIAKTSTILS